VFWWVSVAVLPAWGVGVSRLVHVLVQGPAALAFGLGVPFAAVGSPTEVDGIGPESVRAR
jgi:hypothetical protein